MNMYMKAGLGTMTLMSVIPIVTGAVSCSSNSKTSTKNDSRISAIEDLIMPFPVLDSYVYYPYIRVNGKGSYISDDMIAKVVTNVIKGLTFTSQSVT